MQATAVLHESGELITSGTTDCVPWWSFTKTAVAIAALKLVEIGSLRLDGAIPGERFTLRHLLRHEAGLPDYGALDAYHGAVAAGADPWPVERLLAALDSRRLRFEPGSSWRYSNIGYLRIRQLLEEASRMSLAAALETLVFAPAGIQTARLATTPSDLSDAQMGDAVDYHPGWVFPGLIVGCVADAAKLLLALIGGRLVKPETFAEMLKGRALPEFRGNHPDPAYGLGLMLWASNPLDHPLGHMGAGPGSKIAVLASNGRAAAVWTSTTDMLDAEAQAIALLS